MRLSAVIITYNEQDRLAAALASLAGVADEVLVVDSHSEDRTVEIARAAGARVILNRFQDYGQQKNFALAQAGHEWVLNLDADERLSPELRQAVAALKQAGARPGTSAFAVQRRTFYLGRWIRHSGWYPDRKVRLFRKGAASWQGRVHERLIVEGAVAALPGAILHYTYRDIGDHLRRLDRYTSLQAGEIAAGRRRALLARALLLPPITFFRHYFFKLGLLDGFPGLVIALLSSWATALKYLKAREARNARDENPSPRLG